MATYYLINKVTLGTQIYNPGDFLDSAQDPIANIQAAGGRVVLSSVAGVAAAAAQVQAMKARGAGIDEEALADIMNVAADEADVAAAGGDVTALTAALAASTGAAMIGYGASTASFKFGSLSTAIAAEAVRGDSFSTAILDQTSRGDGFSTAIADEVLRSDGFSTAFVALAASGGAAMVGTSGGSNVLVDLASAIATIASDRLRILKTNVFEAPTASGNATLKAEFSTVSDPQSVLAADMAAAAVANLALAPRQIIVEVLGATAFPVVASCIGVDIDANVLDEVLSIGSPGADNTPSHYAGIDHINLSGASTASVSFGLNTSIGFLTQPKLYAGSTCIAGFTGMTSDGVNNDGFAVDLPNPPKGAFEVSGGSPDGSRSYVVTYVEDVP